MNPEQQALSFTSKPPYRVSDDNFHAVISQFQTSSGLVIRMSGCKEDPEIVLDAFETWHRYYYAPVPESQIQKYRNSFAFGIFDGDEHSRRSGIGINFRVLDLMKFEISERDKK